MNNDMLPAGMTANIKPVDLKCNGGDLINRDALKRALNYIYDCAYIDSISKEKKFKELQDFAEYLNKIPEHRPYNRLKTENRN